MVLSIIRVNYIKTVQTTNVKITSTRVKVFMAFVFLWLMTTLFMNGCVSLFRCNKGMCMGETSQRIAVAKTRIGISDGFCNAFLGFPGESRSCL